MRFTIQWSSRAERSYGEQLEYLFNNWGKTSVVKFLDHTEKVLQQIAETPRMYPFYNRKENVYRCVLNRQLSLYYKI